MMDLLKRFEEENVGTDLLEEGSEDETDETGDLQRRLAGINLGIISHSSFLRNYN